MKKKKDNIDQAWHCTTIRYEMTQSDVKKEAVCLRNSKKHFNKMIRLYERRIKAIKRLRDIEIGNLDYAISDLVEKRNWTEARLDILKNQKIITNTKGR